MRMLRSLLRSNNNGLRSVGQRAIYTTSYKAQEHDSIQQHPSAAPQPVSSIWNKLLVNSKTPRVPLTEPFPGLPTINESGSEPSVSDKVQITTLPSGLRVASVSSVSPISSIGIFIDAGSRYENLSNNGISHFLELMAFKTTSNRSDFRLVRDMLSIGANISATSSREHLIYNIDALNEHIPQAFEALSDVIQNTSFLPDEVIAVQDKYIEDYDYKYGQNDILILEAIQEAAYRNTSVGLPLYPHKDVVGLFTPQALKEYVKTFFTPSRIVVSGVGINHDALVDLTQRFFNNLSDDKKIDKPATKYSGGEIRIHKRNSPDGLTHVALAFETASWHDSELVPMCVLTQLMGGGGSFSAGGPGKGMYSRLYTNVLNQYQWVESATCFNSVFTDSGLFGFYGTTQPEYSNKLVEVLISEAKKMAGRVDDIELSRAKNQLKSAVLMQIEQRMLKLEDIGRQVVVYGKVITPNELCQQIDNVTAQDIQNVAKKLLSTNLTLAAIGDCSNLPRYEEIQKLIK